MLSNLNQFALIFNFKSFSLFINLTLNEHVTIPNSHFVDWWKIVPFFFFYRTPSFQLLHLNTTFLVNFPFVCLWYPHFLCSSRQSHKKSSRERKERKHAIESVMLDLAQPSHSLRKLRRSGCSHTRVVKATQEEFHRRRWRSGRREWHQERGMKRKKQRAQAVLRTVVSPFQVHPSLLLGALSSLAEMDYASKRKE